MSHRRRLLADQDGFTLVAVTITMMVLGLFAVTAWAAANNALPSVTHDSNRKQAYEAAEAGAQWYTYQLEKDTNYWTKCADVPNGVNMQGSRVGWRNVPGSAEQFSVELIGSTNATTCHANPDAALLDQGILTVRVTGRAGGQQRQIVTKFRRSGFLDYIYYTKRETSPPEAYQSNSDVETAKTACDKNRAARDAQSNHFNCSEIEFPGGDVIQGPLHTEDDSLLICGSPTFGRTTADAVEIRSATDEDSAFIQNGQGCSGDPNVKGTLAAPSKQLDLPDNNASLANVANFKFTGNTCLDFQGTTVNVYPNQSSWGQSTGRNDPGDQIRCTGTPTQKTLLPNTVIWVDNNGTCTSEYAYNQDYESTTTCGDVAVSGHYGANVTVGSANDIIVTGDLTNDSDSMMGLVADQFVRVYHPTTTDSRGNCINMPGVTPVHTIESAILATNGSFLTDNWYCGATLGTLNVSGAIAQYWRGAVGTGSGASAGTGYLKNYIYDSRLKYREPPEFLDPKTAQWNLLLQSEQSPVKSN